MNTCEPRDPCGACYRCSPYVQDVTDYAVIVETPKTPGIVCEVCLHESDSVICSVCSRAARMLEDMDV